VLDMILQHDGCVVPDEDFRPGKRARTVDSTAGQASANKTRYRKKDTVMNLAYIKIPCRASNKSVNCLCVWGEYECV
jgi:hypothetical protein